MKATLIKTQEQVSKYGGKFYYAFFKNEQGKGYRSCLYPNCRNFVNWKQFIGKENVWLDNLNTKGNLIDADSKPVEIPVRV
jgi:hypothetical protein